MPESIYSPGLEGVIAGETAISTITGGLQYRGYSIEELAAHASFTEVAYLILHGELPGATELDAFQRRLSAAATAPGPLVELMRHIPPGASMMDVMRTGASALAHWDPDTADNSHDANLRKAERLLAQLPVVMAARHRLVQGKEPVPANHELSFAANVLWMLFREEPSERLARAM